MPLYGGSAADALLGCATPLLFATATGVLRISADQHYATDVLVGSAVGFLGGFGLLLHYGYSDMRGAGSEHTPGRHAFFVPVAGPDTAGVALFGAF